MTNYYDIHTHILPGVDDGSEDLEESAAMLKMAYDEGIMHIIATPHFEVGNRVNASKEVLEAALAKVREKAKEIDENMTISLGNELLDAPGMSDALKKGKALTIGGTRYILVEFLPSDKYDKIYTSMRNYIADGYIPVMAHMERYGCLEKNYDRLDELVKLGVYMQMNTESIIGGLFNRKAAYHRKLIKEGYISFLGSDCHGSENRIPVMQSAVKYLEKDGISEKALQKILVDNPSAMLEDKYI